MAAKKTLLKVLFSAAAAAVLLVSVYFMLGSDVKGYSGLLVNREEQGYAGFLWDLVGRSVELDKQSFTELLAASFERRLGSESSKVDFLLEQMSTGDESQTTDTGTASNLLEFVDAHPLIEKAQLINGQYEILLCTSDEKRVGTVLDRDVYREVFTSGVDGALVDEAAGSIVLYRKIHSAHALLFYYGAELLHSIFSDIPGFVYNRALLTADRVILINFPVIDEGDRENLRNLSQIVLEQKSGFVRIRREQFDKTVYFLPVSQSPSPWIVAVTYDTEQVRISHIGVLILVVQAVVVAAIIIFILTTVKERKKIRIGGVATGRKSVIPGVNGVESSLMGDAGQTGKRVVSGNSDQQDSVGPLSERDDVIPLDDVEEVKELQEFGEAVIAKEYDESQPTVDSAHETESEQTASHQSPEADSEPDSSAVPERVDESVEPLNDTTELEKLEAVQREIMGPEAQMLEEIEELGTIEHTEELGAQPFDDDDEYSVEVPLAEENIEEVPLEVTQDDEENIEEISIEELTAVDSNEFVIDDLAEIEPMNEEHGDIIPNLEALVGADTAPGLEDDGKEITDVLEKEFTAPGENPAGAAEVKHEIVDGMDQQGIIRDSFSQFLQSVGIQKGAVLLKQSTGIYKPCVVAGFSRDTEPKLIFSGKEKIVSKVLERDKILHIRNNVFMDDELGKKFAHSDTSSINSVYFAPLMPSGSDLAGFIVLGPTIHESANSSEVLKKIKEIKKTLTRIL